LFLPLKMDESKFQSKYRIKSTRLPQWDYSSSGVYFVTICTHNRQLYLGDITDGKLTESRQSEICKECWFDLSNRYSNCTADEFVVMPNHVHGIIHIELAETIHELSLQPITTNDRLKRRGMLLPKIIGRFKMQTAKRINEHQKTTGRPFWQ
jgi:putative transposase